MNTRTHAHTQYVYCAQTGTHILCKVSEKLFLEVTNGSAGLTTELIDSLSDFTVSAQTVTSAALAQVLEYLSYKKRRICLILQPHPKIK